jgi:hypothetical protein
VRSISGGFNYLRSIEMKGYLFNFANWIAVDPRRAIIILSVILIVLSLALAASPHSMALAGDLVGGS